MSSEPPFRPEGASTPDDLPPPVPARPSSAKQILLIVGVVGCLAFIGFLVLQGRRAARNEARHYLSMITMKQIGLAMDSHQMATGFFPPRAILDEMEFFVESLLFDIGQDGYAPA